jgi:AraC-like DNA-binding protein
VNAPEPTFSMRLVLPFLEVLRGRIPKEGVAAIEKLDPDTRIPVSVALKLLDHSVARTGDSDLGLKAARYAAKGDYDLLEYTIASSASVREGHEILRRYIQIVNSALDYSIDVQAKLVISRFSTRVPLSRAAADFQLAGVYLAANRWLPAPHDMHREIWFSYPKPTDTTEHERCFRGARLRFGAPFDAILCDRRYLDLPMPGADARLHQLLRQQLEERIAELPPAQQLRRQVRKWVSAELATGNPTAAGIAARLKMSRRTLTRQLVQQGTTFKELLDEVRCELAERALISEDVALVEIAQRLGFREPGNFHRAFRRWTGSTPAEYRERNRVSI